MMAWWAAASCVVSCLIAPRSSQIGERVEHCAKAGCYRPDGVQTVSSRSYGADHAIARVLGVLVAAGVAGVARAEDAAAIAEEPTAEAIANRLDVMKVTVSGAVKPAALMALGKQDFDAAAAKKSMETIATAIATFPSLFPPGSEGVQDRASPDIWKTFDDFKAHAAKLETDAKRPRPPTKASRRSRQPSTRSATIAAPATDHIVWNSNHRSTPAPAMRRSPRTGPALSVPATAGINLPAADVPQ
jgi:cytochrome c556